MLGRFKNTVDTKTANPLKAASVTDMEGSHPQTSNLLMHLTQFGLASSREDFRVSITECVSSQSSEMSESMQSQEHLLSDRVIRSRVEEIVNNFVEKETFARLVTRFLASPLARELGRRYDIWNSLLCSERAYFRNLVLLYEVYYLQLKRTMKDSPGKFSGHHVLSIFQNLEELKALTKKLCKKLEYQKPWPRSIVQIGSAFLSVMDELKHVYATYIKGFSKAFKQLIKANNSLPEFSNVLRESKEFLTSTSEGTTTSLDSLLILPIYHLEKYIHFFEKMHFVTQKGHPDYCDFSKAKQELEAFGLEIKPFLEKALKLYESYRLHFMVVSEMKPKLGELSTNDPDFIRMPIREGPLMLVDGGKTERSHLFLFSNVLVLSVICALNGKKPDQTIPLHGAQVCHHQSYECHLMTLPQGSSQDTCLSFGKIPPYLFELNQGGEKFVFRAQTDAEKRSWMEDLITQINSIKKEKSSRVATLSTLASSRNSSQKQNQTLQGKSDNAKYFSGHWTKYYCDEFLKGIMLCHGELSFLEVLVNSVPLLLVEVPPRPKCLLAYQGPGSNQDDFYLHIPFLSGVVTSIDPFIRSTSNRSYLPCQCGVVVWSHFTLACVADGMVCSAASRQACECAIKAIVSEFKSANLVEDELRRTVAEILKRYSLAHKLILENQRIIWNAGTTTLLVCVIVKVEPCKASEFCKWCCVSVSIGNGRVYHWSKQKRRVYEVTRHLEHAEPGGRIGPYIYNGCPDLRNLEVSHRFCSAGDVIFLCSQNLCEKFDPEYLGITPSDVKMLDILRADDDVNRLPDNWEELDLNTSLNLRKLYKIYALEKKINSLAVVSPKQIITALMEHYLKMHYLKADCSAGFEPYTTASFKNFEYAACIVYCIDPLAHVTT